METKEDTKEDTKEETKEGTEAETLGKRKREPEGESE